MNQTWLWFFAVVCCFGGVGLSWFVIWFASPRDSELNRFLGAMPRLGATVVFSLGVVGGFVWNGGTQGIIWFLLWGALGIIVGLALVPLARALWAEDAGNTNIHRVQAIALCVQTLVLAATLIYVSQYVLAAREQAEATHRLVEAALEDRASILVVEDDEKGLETVGACKKKGIEIKGLTDDPAKHDWLVIKIRNEGNRTAHNVTAVASWDKGKEEATAKNTGWMAENRGALGKHTGKVWHYWRVWQLHEHDERFFYVRPPKPPPTKSDKSISLNFIWYDPLYYGWTNHIRVFKPADKWYTSWDEEATPLPQW